MRLLVSILKLDFIALFQILTAQHSVLKMLPPT